MSSIVTKGRGDQAYVYLVESARVDGKPRIVNQVYLGTKQEVLDRLTSTDPGLPGQSEHRAFGDVAAVWQMIRKLGVAAIIDEVAGPVHVHPSCSVGSYLALAICNRIVDPCSKLAFADWWKTTSLPRMLKIPAGALDHRRFWLAMDALSENELAVIEQRLMRRAIEVFGLATDALILDMTNFATFISSANPRAGATAQRGKAKQKRTDLRLVGLGLVATRDGAIPLLSHAYRGDRPDVTQFGSMVTALSTRYGDVLGGGAGVTLTFDAGQNSGPNFALLPGLHLHYVGTVPPSDHPDLISLPATDRALVDDQRFPGVTACETRKVVLGADRRTVLTHSPSLHAAQQAGFAQTLARATRCLAELAAVLERGKARRGRPQVEAAIAAICKARWVSDVLAVELTGDTPATMRLTWTIDAGARQAVEERWFGKRILVTDHDHWSTADLIGAYRAQSELEECNRQLKDPHVVSFSPMHHWTDEKIRVHVFYCVLALTIAHLMRREAENAGHHLSVRALLASLRGIGETVLLYQGERGRPRARHMITKMDPLQQALYELFDLQQWAPAR